MKPQLHISGINTFTRCGEQFRRRYICGEKIPPGIALIVGIATDKSVSANLKNKIDTDELLPIEAVQSFASDAVENQFNAGEILLDDEQKKDNDPQIYRPEERLLDVVQLRGDVSSDKGKHHRHGDQ